MRTSEFMRVILGMCAAITGIGLIPALLYIGYLTPRVQQYRHAPACSAIVHNPCKQTIRVDIASHNTLMLRGYAKPTGATSVGPSVGFTLNTGEHLDDHGGGDAFSSEVGSANAEMWDGHIAVLFAPAGPGKMMTQYNPEAKLNDALLVLAFIALLFALSCFGGICLNFVSKRLPITKKLQEEM